KTTFEIARIAQRYPVVGLAAEPLLLDGDRRIGLIVRDRHAKAVFAPFEQLLLGIGVDYDRLVLTHAFEHVKILALPEITKGIYHGLDRAHCSKGLHFPGEKHLLSRVKLF